MASLKGRHIIVGVTGSIAAYKTATLIRLLVKQGAEVRVIMTPLAKEFITPLTLATLSKHSILVDFFNPENGDWNSHVDLGLWADAYLIAPATANTLAKMARGIADNLLLTTYLSARCPVFVAPAMDLDMFRHPATQENLAILQSRGNRVIEPASGELASGLDGKGRMEEPEAIAAYLSDYFAGANRFQGKKILVTAGPTYEAIDPVRFIGNHSSGKMGYAIAESLANQGAEVVLVSGPVHLTLNNSGVRIVKVNSANEMYEACLAEFPTSNAAIMAAAVADYAPVDVASEKIKRASDEMVLTLKPNPDIAAALGAQKKANQTMVGFALETNNLEQNALVKLKKKNLDFIVLNAANEKGAGFNSDTNRISIIHHDGKLDSYDMKSKVLVADDIVSVLYNYMINK